MKNQAMTVVEHPESDFEHVVLETKPTLAVDNTRDHEWLAREVYSTPFATILD